MSEFIFYSSDRKIKNDELKKYLNLAGTFDNVEIKESKENIAGVSYLKNSPVRGERIIENDEWIILFAGDLIGFQSVPFKMFSDAIEKNNFEAFSDLEGYFAITAFNKPRNKIYLISDKLSNYPVYYSIEPDRIIISSSLSSIIKFSDKPEFNEKWLYHYLFFNYPVNSITYLKNVFQIQPSSYIEIDLNSKEKTTCKYEDFLKEKEKLLIGKEALEYAADVFKSRIPEYFKGSDKIACALTSGWDGRTNLALAPDYRKTSAYTYGIPGCGDLAASREITDKLRIKRKSVYFNRKFLKSLPELIYETVYISSGLQGILRSTLLYVYRELAASGFNLAISGINYDSIFRGHFGIPSSISLHFAEIMKKGEINIEPLYWKRIFNGRYDTFESEIKSKLNLLKDDFGDFNSSCFHLSYSNYIDAHNYFGGEMKIANNFITTRVPGYDGKIMELAYSIKRSTLTFSEIKNSKRNSREEMVLQAYLFKKYAKAFYNIPVRHTKPGVVLSGDIPFYLYNYYCRIKNKLFNELTFKRNQNKLEDWNKWLNIDHKEFIDDLIFDKSSLIREYIRDEFIQDVKKNREHRMIGKLTTLEIILRLIQNKYQRFWEN